MLGYLTFERRVRFSIKTVPRCRYSPAVAKKIFTYEQAAELLPEVQRLTDEAVERVDALSEEAVEDYQLVVQGWAEEMLARGIEVKGLWLIDFDSGSGFYCWQHPEPSLQHYHGYEEGFGARVKLQ